MTELSEIFIVHYVNEIQAVFTNVAGITKRELAIHRPIVYVSNKKN